MRDRTTQRALAALVRAQTGIAEGGPLAANMVDSMERAAMAAGFADDRLYRAAVESDPRLLDALVDEIVIGETYFYRDPAQFEILRTLVFPWGDPSRALGFPVRLWSAGCASGEEAWSLAVEAFRSGLEGSVSVLGTDVSAAAIATARRGRYGPRAFRGARTPPLFPYFEPHGGEWWASEGLRACVRFDRHNLASGAPPAGAPFDAVFCRNVLIYLDASALTRAVEALRLSLKPGGFLLLAPTDPFPASPGVWEALTFPHGIAHRKVAHRRNVTSAPAQPIPIGGDPFAHAGAERGCQPTPSEALLSKHPIESGVDTELDALRARANHDPAGALDACVRARVRAPDNPALLHLEGLLLLSLGRPPEAVRAFEQLVTLVPGEPGAHAALGFALRYAGDGATSESRFRGALTLTSERPAEARLVFTDGFTAGGFRSLLVRLSGVSDSAPFPSR